LFRPAIAKLQSLVNVPFRAAQLPAPFAAHRTQLICDATTVSNPSQLVEFRVCFQFVGGAPGVALVDCPPAPPSAMMYDCSNFSVVMSY